MRALEAKADSINWKECVRSTVCSNESNEDEEQDVRTQRQVRKFYFYPQSVSKQAIKQKMNVETKRTVIERKRGKPRQGIPKIYVLVGFPGAQIGAPASGGDCTWVDRLGTARVLHHGVCMGRGVFHSHPVFSSAW